MVTPARRARRARRVNSPSRKRREALLVKRGLCYRAPRWLPGVAILFAVLTGCSQQSGYPADYKYPARTDLLVGDGQKGKAVRELPPPGQLEGSIAKLKDNPDAKVLDPADLNKTAEG